MRGPEIRGIRAAVPAMMGLRSTELHEVMVMVAYLDDAGTDSQNRFVSLSGFIGTLDSWHAFEADAAKLMVDYHVTYVRGRHVGIGW